MYTLLYVHNTYIHACRLLYRILGWGGGVGHSKGGVFVYPPMGVFGNGGVVVQMGGGVNKSLHACMHTQLYIL